MPSLLGGMNWGGISIDESTGLMFVNDMRMPLRMSLVRKEDMGNTKYLPMKFLDLWEQYAHNLQVRTLE